MRTRFFARLAIVTAAFACHAAVVATVSRADWSRTGVPISADSPNIGGPVATTDGNGGAIAAWVQQDPVDLVASRVMAQRVSAYGSGMWSEGGILLAECPAWIQAVWIVSDGDGGALILWSPGLDVSTGETDLSAQRIDRYGRELWQPGGVPVCVGPGNPTFPRLAADGAGGAFIAWCEVRPGPGASWKAYGQWLDGTGRARWQPNGVPVALQGIGPVYAGLCLEPDGMGGAYVLWEYAPWATTPGGISIQRVSEAGAVAWPAGPITMARKYQPATLAASAGRLWLAYVDTPESIQLIRVGPDGTLDWPPGTRPLCTAVGAQLHPQLAADGQGGAFAVWADGRDAGSGVNFAQRVGPDGTALWKADGVAVNLSADPYSSIAIISDGFGGCLGTWVRGSQSADADIYLQRILPDGTMGYASEGISLFAGLGHQAAPRLVPDGTGQAIVVWIDRRQGNAVYAARPTSGVRLLSPIGGETWPPSSLHDIRWIGDAVGSVQLEYSADAGVSWRLIQSAVPNTGTYCWQVPRDPSFHALVRATRSLDGEWDESAGEFTIPSSPPQFGTPMGELYLSAEPRARVASLSMEPLVPSAFFVVTTVDFGDIGRPELNADNGLAAWEARVVVPPQLLVIGRTLSPSTSLNLGSLDNWIVGTGQMLPAQDTPLALARYDVVVVQEGLVGLRVTLGAPTPSSFDVFEGPGPQPGWLEAMATGECPYPCIRPFASEWKSAGLIINPTAQSNATLALEIDAAAGVPGAQIDVGLSAAIPSRTVGAQGCALASLEVRLTWNAELASWVDADLVDPFSGVYLAHEAASGAAKLVLACAKGMTLPDQPLDLLRLRFRLAGVEGSCPIEMEAIRAVDTRLQTLDIASRDGWLEVRCDAQPCAPTAVAIAPLRTTRLFAVQPNPFNPRTSVTFELTHREVAIVSVFDASGRRIRVLAHGEFDAGVHRLTWDGRDASMAGVGSGTYFIRLDAGSVTQVQKGTLLR